MVKSPSVDASSFRRDGLPKLRNMVADHIRLAISTNRLPPGSRLIERELCKLLGVSRTSVREALRQLESEGLVSSKGGRLIVTVISRKEAAEIYQLRVVVESLAARLFAKNAGKEHVVALGSATRNLAARYKTGVPAEILMAKTELYEALFAGAGNAMAASLLRNIHAKVSLLRFASLSSEGRARQSMREIRALVKALKSRDAERAAQLAVQHVENASEAAMRAQFGGVAAREKRSLGSAAVVQ